MTNGQGRGFSRQDDFELYDKLPHAVREFLAFHAVPNISAASALSVKRRHGLDDAELLDEIERLAAHETLRQCRALYGPEHPYFCDHGHRLDTGQ